ncbi:acyl-CoA dehydrogenase [Rhodococcus sp. WB1]|jgi:aminoglycoside phosphotransferase (APT) family kinase protein|uniref:Phosphotransferase family protein n=1 Tax=Rhodococcus aetherivorans TaxID=191292 RepID=A0A059MHL8_9NOCA|nr:MULTISPECIES: phosphotransferase family protein [Rhodococcus]ANZ27313.1 acyl-CoA dehydrogenase [Rhodococcus sp. WB1]KDE10406.1 acyl-CoA dehydrogenase [Rhodococcus aetherivorans]MBC2590515.1 phosphotransferase family protein [Rhodococcus aetherivorans]MDV6295417.1 phosphotransferase family protein [Rhodococcus aetherivorans]PND50396.1 phosphotransferase family protein [Rhodococcus sp. ENV425]
MTASPAGAVADLDLDALTVHLQRVLGGEVTGALTASLIGGGRSNPTYRLADDEHAWVLRRPPYGHVLPSAHDMRREFTVINALGGTSVPVPRAVHLCEDESILGAKFYLMELVDGVAVGTVEQASALTADERRRLGFSLADTLAALHDIDPDAVGLGSFGRPDGYLERQLGRWAKQWEASRRVDRPEVAVLLDKLRRALPQTRHPGIVHGDVKLDNVLAAPQDRGRIAAVLDWEMATLGDTLADVGIMLSFWDVPGAAYNPITRGLATLDGFPTRTELLERYAAARGIDLADIDWYTVFADFKIAVILEGIGARHDRGETVGEGFDGIADMVGPLLRRALDLAATSALPELRR